VNGALATPEYLESAGQQLRELIRQNFNHPSICFWGVGNETSGPAADGVIAALARVARAEDPARLSTYASNHDNADPKNWHTDVVAFNRYYGWYQGSLSDFAAWLDRTRADYPKARFGMSEFGAGASIFQHEENPGAPKPGGRFHPEEYQNLSTRPTGRRSRQAVRLGQVHLVPPRLRLGRGNEGDHPGRNDKGLVTYDRRVKKDAFFFYKANWSSEPGPAHHQLQVHRADGAGDGGQGVLERARGGARAEREVPSARRGTRRAADLPLAGRKTFLRDLGGAVPWCGFCPNSPWSPPTPN
jgi:beta-galactosidase